MSEIHIRRPHGMTQAKARRAAEQIADELAAEFEMRHAWEGSTLTFTRSGVTGHIAVTAADIEIRAKLGFLLGFLKPTIEQEIHRFCDEKFGAAPALDPAAPTAAGRRGRPG